MAKQSPRHVARGKPTPHTPTKDPTPQPGTAIAPVEPPPRTQGRRATYVDAIAVYEQAIRTLQQHNYAKAADLLQHMIATFPEERELIERSRLYVSLCDRHLKPPVAEPQSTAERLYAATLALNSGALDRATIHLERILADQPANDQALYMLAVAHSERGDLRLAIRYLEQAIEANPENRGLARLDPDLEDLREEDAAIEILERAIPRAVDRKRASHRR